eukprot:12039421-Alexandrium_andersonii.AAC.1
MNPESDSDVLPQETIPGPRAPSKNRQRRQRCSAAAARAAKPRAPRRRTVGWTWPAHERS